MLIDGVHIPLTAPFAKDGSSFLRKLEYNVGRYSLTPAAGFVALTGEGAALSDKETRESLRVIGETAAAEKVLVVAVSKASVREALALIEQAAGAGFDVAMVGAPVGWQGLVQAEIELYFKAVADGSTLPVMLWSEGFAIPVATLAELAGHWNIAGVYDAGLTLARYGEIAEATRGVKREVRVTTVFAPVTGRMAAAAEVGTMVTAKALAGGTAVLAAPSNAGLKTRVKTVGFQVMAAGSSKGLVELLSAGVAGAMPTLAACAPQGCYETYAAFKDGDAALAAEKEQRLAEADALVESAGVAAVKYGCDLNGYFGGGVRLPRLGLDRVGTATVERVLAGLRN